MSTVARVRVVIPLLVCLGSACGSEGNSESQARQQAEPATQADPPDAGSPGPMDAARETDAGRHHEDAGRPEQVCGQSAIGNGWGELPESCLPRCSAETGVAYRKCETEECRTAVLAGDASPLVRVDTYAGIRTVSCSGFLATHTCKGWQTYSCLADACPDAYYTAVSCTGDCKDQYEALNQCAEANPLFAPCLSERVNACFEGE